MTAYISNLSTITTIILLVVSNFFMLAVWYYHLNHPTNADHR